MEPFEIGDVVAGKYEITRVLGQGGMGVVMAARHRELGDYMLVQMQKRGAESWTSPDPALRCAIVTVNVPPIQRTDLETWLWKTRKIRIRGGDPNKLRLSTPYYVQKKDIDRFLEKFDEYKREKKLV